MCTGAGYCGAPDRQWLKPRETGSSRRAYGLIRFGSRMDVYLPVATEHQGEGRRSHTRRRVRDRSTVREQVNTVKSVLADAGREGATGPAAGRV